MSDATRAGRVRNFHLPLPDDLHRQLREEAARSGRPATAVVREAVEEYLRERRKAAVHDEIAAYAERWGGTPIDLDDALEAAATEQLVGRKRARR